jgi:hypothetical protein
MYYLLGQLALNSSSLIAQGSAGVFASERTASWGPDFLSLF